MYGIDVGFSNSSEVREVLLINFYTADLHYGHKGVILYDHRPFADIQEMDGVLIALWNGRVQVEWIL